MRRLLLALSLAVPLPLLAQPDVTLEPQAAVASGLTPGGQVVWFGIAREISEDSATIVRRDRIDVADAKGGARFDLGRDVALKSIWVAIDLATGKSAVATPAAFPLADSALPVSDLHLGATAAEADAIEDARTAVEVLMVRPGSGAWGLSVGRGGPDDEGGGGGGPLRFSLGRLHALAKGGPVAPAKLDPKDLVILIDPNRMEIVRGRGDGGRP
ncbi:MAG TPA: hypothetical protein VGE98_00375 [Thermoanaerobaculia bacterium]